MHKEDKGKETQVELIRAGQTMKWNGKNKGRKCKARWAQEVKSSN